MISFGKKYLPIAILLFFSLFLFRNYFLKHTVPFPANLLVATYEPWKSYPTPEYPNGPPNKPMGFDNVRIYYPLKSVAIDAIRRFTPPLWNPYNFTGNPLLATYQSAIFHPLFFLFLLLPTIDAWSITIILQPVVTALSMYWMLSVFGFSRKAKFLGALAFAFSGFFMVWWEEAYMFSYSALFLPLAIGCAEQYRKQSKPLWLALLSVSVAGSIVSGAFQMTFYLVLTLLLWCIYRNGIKRMLPYIISIAVALFLSGVHLVPNLEAYWYSSRIAVDAKYIFDANLLPLWHLVTMIAPDYFGNPGTYNYSGLGFYHERMIWIGVVPLVLTLLSVIAPPKLPHARFFLLLFGVSLSLVFSLPTTWVLLYYAKIPILSSLTPTRMMMVTTFAAAVITAMKTEQMGKAISKRHVLIAALILFTAILVAAAAPVITYLRVPKTPFPTIQLRNLVIPTAGIVISLAAFLLAAFKPTLRAVSLALLVLVTLGTTVLFSNKFHYFSERRFVFPDTPLFTALHSYAGTNRFWTYENGYLEKNFASQYGLYSPEGYDSITIRRYAEFLAFANSHGKNHIPSRSDALISSTDHLSSILTDPYRVRALALTGVTTIVQKNTPDRGDQSVESDSARFPLLWNDQRFLLKANSLGMPRTFLASSYQLETTPERTLTTLFSPDFSYTNTLLLDRTPVSTPDPTATGTATILTSQPNTVAIKTETNGPMLIYLADAWYPGWKAYIEGKQTPLYRANYAFRAAFVPKGTHTMEFRYEPISWTLGIGTTVLGILCLVLLLRYGHRF